MSRFELAQMELKASPPTWTGIDQLSNRQVACRLNGKFRDIGAMSRNATSMRQVQQNSKCISQRISSP
jgi:hypothetical protein